MGKDQFTEMIRRTKAWFGSLLAHSDLEQGYDARNAVDDFLLKYRARDFRDAYRVLCEDMERCPELSQIGDVWLMLAHLELIVKHNALRALEHLAKAQELGCRMMDFYHLTRAQALWHTGDNQAASEYFERSLEVERTVWNLMEFAMFLSYTDDERAGAILQEVLEKDPNHALAHIYLGRQAMKSDDADRGRLFAKKAETLNPGPNEFFELGKLYHDLGDFEAGIRAYLEADRLSFWDRISLYANMADCHLALGRIKEAREYAERSLRFDPENGEAKQIWEEVQRRVRESEKK